MIRITPDITIDESELAFHATTSQGPGGQHVNRSRTRIVLRFDVGASPSLSDSQRARIREKLGSRIQADGVLQLSSQKHRSQWRNREAAIARLVTLLAEALAPEVPRRATKPSRASKQRRLEEKRRQASRKRERRRPAGDD
ncbi:MAG: alternative ribosome rescue aminoacyl-tRNA hydrolase ArfB [bacterium]